MKTVSTIAERDAVPNPIRFLLRADGKIDVYQVGDKLPRVVEPTPQEAAAAAAKEAQDVTDAATARSYAKLKALSEMTPAQVQTWVAANVTNLAQAQDAIATLAIAVAILARRL